MKSYEPGKVLVTLHESSVLLLSNKLSKKRDVYVYSPCCTVSSQVLYPQNLCRIVHRYVMSYYNSGEV